MKQKFKVEAVKAYFEVYADLNSFQSEKVFQIVFFPLICRFYQTWTLKISAEGYDFQYDSRKHVFSRRFRLKTKSIVVKFLFSQFHEIFLDYCP